MTTEVFQFKSVGVKHYDESYFFKFITKARFREAGNRSIEWCDFDGLKITCTTLEPSIVDFVKLILDYPIESSNGHKYILER